MDQTGRKATDVLLALEAKIDLLLNHYRSQELNLKILSNKVNLLIEQLSSQPENSAASPAPKITIEATDFTGNIPTPPINKQVKVSSDFNLAVSPTVAGAKRTSRETDEASQHPLERKRTMTVPVDKLQDKNPEVPSNAPQVKQEVFVPPKLSEANSVQVTQRIINKNNGSVFLADVEIKSIANDTVIHKTRTNGVGKWVGTLPPGQYRVTVKKQGASNKDTLQVSQDITLDGFKSLVELSDLQIK